MSKVNYGLLVETSRPYLNVQSD